MMMGNQYEGTLQDASLVRAVEWLRAGRLVVYPTETLYALGCMATDAGACAAVARAKGRPEGKPFPLLVADWDMVQEFFFLTGPAQSLAQAFWPGPLTVLLPPRRPFPLQVHNRHGGVAVRMTPHPVAASLCRGCGVPLVATSANRSGEAPPAHLCDLHPSFVQGGALVVDALPWPAGGPPSTLVAVEEGRLRVVREGAIARTRLMELGYELV